MPNFSKKSRKRRAACLSYQAFLMFWHRRRYGVEYCLFTNGWRRCANSEVIKYEDWSKQGT